MHPLKNTAAVRQHNMATLLQLIESRGPISRAELSRISGLSQPTVSGAMEGILKSRLVRAIGAGDSTGGRRPELLAYNAEAGFVVGVDLGGTNLKLGLTDLAGKILHRVDEPTPRENAAEGSVTRAIFAAVERLVKESGIMKKDIIGIGIGAPGVTDPDTGLVALAPAVGWNKTPVKRLLSERFGLPCHVDNDVNAAALAEMTFGSGPRLGNFVFLAIGTGIGAGVVIDGKLHRGRNHAAGEVGYLVIDHTWNPGSVTDFGCLESMAAAPAILRKGVSVLRAPEHNTDPVTVEAVFDLARRGDDAAVKVVEEVAGYLGIALANLAVVLDPEAIILGGGVSQAGDLLVELVKRKLKQVSPIVPQVYVSSLGADAGMLGAAALAIDAAKERLLNAI
ncbi:MAG: ROK family protein [Firmicutes bacterium]|nr:ROK family protein [Bacillota bacterium]